MGLVGGFGLVDHCGFWRGYFVVLDDWDVWVLDGDGHGHGHAWGDGGRGVGERLGANGYERLRDRSGDEAAREWGRMIDHPWLRCRCRCISNTLRMAYSYIVGKKRSSRPGIGYWVIELKLKTEQGGRPCPSCLQGFLINVLPRHIWLGSLADGQLDRSLIPRLKGKPGYHQAS